MFANKCSLVAGVAQLLVLTSSTMARSPLTDSTDVHIGPDQGYQQETESSVCVSPLNPDVVLVGNVVASSSAHLSAWISTNGGKLWLNNLEPIPAAYDPAVAIIGDSALGDSGRFLVRYLVTLAQDKTQWVRYKNGPSVAWSTPIGLEVHELTDEGHLWVDNSPYSAHRHKSYAGWSEAVPVEEGGGSRIVIKRSVPPFNGSDWTNPREFLAPPAVDNYHGVNLQTGRTGRVYAIWEVDKSQFATDFAVAISNDGGFTWLNRECAPNLGQV